MSSEKPGSTKSGKTRKAAQGSKRTARVRKTPAVRPKAPSRPLVLLTGSGPIVSAYAASLLDGPYDIGVLLPRGIGVDPSLPKEVRPFLRLDKRASVVVDVTLGDVDAKRRSLEQLDRFFSADTLLLSNAFVIPISEQASWITGKHRLLGVGILPGFLDKPLIEISPSTMTLTNTVDAARVFFTSLGKDTELVQDGAGLVSARIICQIINEAAFALQDDIARPEDIDTSMKLGVSYPYGPFEWAERIGIDNVVAILHALHGEYGEERYRVAPLLQRLATGGVWWTPSTTSAHAGESS